MYSFPIFLAQGKSFGISSLPVTPNYWDVADLSYLDVLLIAEHLKPISLNVSQSPKLLKAIIGSGRIYVRPLQKDLDLEPVESNSLPSCSYKII